MRCGVLRADLVVVNKARREMLLLRGQSVLRSYRVRLGRDPKGHKQREGDVKIYDRPAESEEPLPFIPPYFVSE